MEGKENKLTTFSTWTIMLGCNESNNIIFQQHLCKLGQLRKNNGRNSQVSVKQDETNWPLQKVFTLQGKRHCTYYQQQGGELYRRFVNFGRESTVAVVYVTSLPHAQFYHVTVRWMTKYFVRRCQSHLCVQSMLTLTHAHTHTCTQIFTDNASPATTDSVPTNRHTLP